MADHYESTTLVQTTQEESQEFKHDGGPCYVTMQGNFGGCTATLEGSIDGGTTFGIATDIITGNTISVAAGTTGVLYTAQIVLPPSRLKVTTSSISGTTNLTVVFSNVA